ncbi:TetR/AcrR family transcriptional regulator [Sunxiuqinia sp. sy24]|uniref:TetR/AcrR family transcriptional regulator n=1 Tax=Sunxiuqinia sp. sy24 TaxID=3461495 RepID=UPI004045C92F
MTEKDEQIKHEILIEAQKLFQQFGMRKTTMDEIAAACGKAKSTLYHYFKSKDEVFEAVIKMEMMNLRKLVKSKVEEQKGMVAKIKTYVIEFHKEVSKKANLFRLMKQDYTSLGVSRKHFLSMMEFEQAYIIRILEDGYDSGEYSTSNREDIPWLSEMFLSSFCGIVQYSLEKEGFYNEEKMIRFVNLITPKVFS